MVHADTQTNSEKANSVRRVDMLGG
jgi:hypothetical protein